MWWMLGSAALGAATQYISGRKAKTSADDQAYENAKLTRMETAEELRRMDRAQLFREGANIAQIGQSGIRMSKGTTAQRQMQEFKAEFQRQREWFKQTGDQRAKVARQGGQGVGQSSMLGAGATLGQGISNYLTYKEFAK